MSSIASQEAAGTPTAFWNEPSNVAWRDDATASSIEGGCIESVAAGHWLYRAAESKDAVYYIEAGAVVVSRDAPDGSLIESRIAYSGEYLGLGFLASHRSSAVAAIASTITRYTLEEFEELCDQNPELRQARDDAIRAEFEQIRSDATDRASQSSLTAKVANLLSVASHLAELEGREPDLSADWLDLNQLSSIFRVERLVMLTSLLRLEHAGIIGCNPEFQIKILDRGSLEDLAKSGPERELEAHGDGGAPESRDFARQHCTG